MKKLLFLILAGLVFVQCTDDEDSSCSTLATVRDLTGLDGCQFVFELEDGTRLEPIRSTMFCGTPPLPKEVTEDPLYNFEFVDGKRVKISYNLVGSMSVCMVGPVVKITCIQEVPVLNPEED